MKRLFSLLLSLALLFSLGSFSAAAEDAAEIAGIYELVSVDGPGTEGVAQMIDLMKALGMPITLTVQEDGSAVLRMADEEQTAVFDVAAGTYSSGGNINSFRCEGGNLILEDAEIGGTMHFIRSSAAPVSKGVGAFRFFTLVDVLDPNGSSILEAFADYFPVEDDPSSVTTTLYPAGDAVMVDSSGRYDYFFDFDSMTFRGEDAELSSPFTLADGELRLYADNGTCLVLTQADPGRVGPYELVDMSEDLAASFTVEGVEDADPYLMMRALGMLPTLTIDENGRGELSLFSETMELAFDFDAMTVSSEGEAIPFTYDKGTLSFGSDSSYMCFGRVTALPGSGAMSSEIPGLSAESGLNAAPAEEPAAVPAADELPAWQLAFTGRNEFGKLELDGWSGLSAVAAGGYHVVGLRPDGTVIAAGGYGDSMCDVSGWQNIVAIAAGGHHTVGLRTDGTVVACGVNDLGQCNVGSWTGISKISAGDNHTLGLRTNGTVVAVGDNSSGQCEVGGWTGITMIAGGSNHSVGLRSDGTVVAAGYNRYGQCDVTGWTNVSAVAAGTYHTVGLRADGTVVAAGSNNYGQCDVEDWTGIIAVYTRGNVTVGVGADRVLHVTGDNSFGQRDLDGTSGMDLLSAAVGSRHTLLLHMDGSVSAVGEDAGRGAVDDWSGIVAVAAGDYQSVGLRSDGTVVAVCTPVFYQCMTDSWTRVKAIAAGGYFTLGLREDGTVLAVGATSSGQCNVTGWADIVAVAAGWQHSVGLRSDGTVVAAGDNRYGQRGVADWTGITAIAAGMGHTVGLRSDGTVVAVGDNQYGQCDVAGWTDIVAVSAGLYHTLGLKADGTVVFTGNNEYGQGKVTGWTNITAIAAGSWHSVGLKADGSVVAAGGSNYGQNDVSGWKNVVAVSAGMNATLALFGS